LQGFVCLSILVKCLNLDSMIGQLMWTEICTPTCWSAGEEQFWNPVGGSCCRGGSSHIFWGSTVWGTMTRGFAFLPFHMV
jgi:hypothetical protein